MNSDEIPSDEDQMRFAIPFAETVLDQIQSIIDSAKGIDRATAVYAITKSLSLIWIDMMRQAEIDKEDAIEMMDDLWDKVEMVDVLMQHVGEMQ